MNNKPPKITLREAAEMAVNVLEGLGYDPIDLRSALADLQSETGFERKEPDSLKAEPVKQEPVTIESAEKMGATGAIPTESERKLFEAWMRGHCWAISGVWDGKTYVDSAETGGYINPLTMHVRCLWAAWRDRAALGAPVQPVQEPVADESPRFETEDHDLTTLLELTVDIYSGICNHDTAVWWHETLGKVEAKLTPVDAKAIGDALLFLVERCNEQGFYSPIKQPIVQTALAAIRGLK